MIQSEHKLLSISVPKLKGRRRRKRLVWQKDDSVGSDSGESEITTSSDGARTASTIGKLAESRSSIAAQHLKPPRGSIFHRPSSTIKHHGLLSPQSRSSIIKSRLPGYKSRFSSEHSHQASHSTGHAHGSEHPTNGSHARILSIKQRLSAKV